MYYLRDGLKVPWLGWLFALFAAVASFGIGNMVQANSVAQAMRFGIARGLFSNESGLGSAAIAHAPARTKEPVREGMVAMLGPFIDTLVICTMTALVIFISGIHETGEFTGATLSAKAFDNALPKFSHHVFSFGLVFFAFTTMVGWSYYGDRSV